DKIRDIVKRVREAVDKAIEAGVTWIITKAKALFGSLFRAKDKKAAKNPKEALKAAMAEANKLTRGDEVTVESIMPKITAIRSTYGIKTLDLVVEGENEEATSVHIHGEINPNGNTPTAKIPKDGRQAEIGKIEIPREKMSFRKPTKKTLAQEFKGPASAVNIKTGKILTKKKYGRRHIISFADMRAHYLGVFVPKMTVETAIGKLQKWPPAPQFRKKPVHSKVRGVCRDAFNWPKNLW